MKVRLNFDFYIFFHDFKKGVTICFHYLCMSIFKLIKSFFHYLNYYVFFVPYLILQHKTMRLNYMFIFFWLGKKGVTNPDWKFKIFNVKEDNNQQTSQIWLVFNGIHLGFIALPHNFFLASGNLYTLMPCSEWLLPPSTQQLPMILEFENYVSHK